MIKKKLNIKGIPAILWGNDSDKLFIAVHGNQSNKEDDIMAIFAEYAIAKNYQVLSFDLPEHGERKDEDRVCDARNSVEDLERIMAYAQSLSADISLFACSLGAYFSLLAYKDIALDKALFLSPVVDMQRIINNMMGWFNVTEARLKEEKEIETPIGQPLVWEYYSYVKEHPISAWPVPTAILYGEKDALCELDRITSFVEQFQCELTIMENGEHFFHTQAQHDFLKEWLKRSL